MPYLSGTHWCYDADGLNPVVGDEEEDALAGAPLREGRRLYMVLPATSTGETQMLRVIAKGGFIIHFHPDITARPGTGGADVGIQIAMAPAGTDGSHWDFAVSNYWVLPSNVLNDSVRTYTYTEPMNVQCSINGTGGGKVGLLMVTGLYR